MSAFFRIGREEANGTLSLMPGSYESIYRAIDSALVWARRTGVPFFVTAHGFEVIFCATAYPSGNYDTYAGDTVNESLVVVR